ncbi:Carboxylesterase [Aspergillus spectabilis]
MVLFTLLILITSAVGVISTPWKQHHRPTAVIDNGIVVGTTTSLPSSTVVVKKFLGIPFAAPPLRFSPPRPARQWRGIYDASEYKPACVQQFNYPEAARNQTIKFFNTPPPPAGESEDCLNLNVFAPATKSKEPKAVLFWLFGGALMFGTGSLPAYDGSSFAAHQDVVVVTINYRTNVFGFPGSPDLPKNERNLGWLDQRLALKWVQQNIAAFGGDPHRVTIFGESAGSGSVDALITLPPPEPVPFHAAIMQSGDSSIRNRADDAGVAWKKLVELAGCPANRNIIRCLRALPALKLKDIIERNALTFGPVHDEATYADHPQKRRLASTAEQPLIARVPLMIGSNARDAWPLITGLNDTDQYLRATFPTFTEEQRQAIIHAYRISAATGIRSPAEQIAVITTEYGFQCPAKLIADGTAGVDVPAWRYFFNASFPNRQIFPGSGAFHSSEIDLVFGTYKREGATEFQGEMSAVMQKAWADFAKSPGSGPGWDAVPDVGVLGGWDNHGPKAVVTLPSDELDRRCEFFDELYAAAI